MARWVALLRGVNVGGNKKVPMKELAAMVEGLGHGDVQTYLQSGNVAFTAAKGTEAHLVAQLERAIVETFAFESKVILRNGKQLDALVAGNPFAATAATDPTKVAVHFLRDNVKAAEVPPTPDGIAEEVVVDGRHIYVSYPNGQGRTQLDDRYWRRYPTGMVSTARNWRTVEALRDLTS